MLAVSVASALTLTLLAPVASADDLNAQRTRVRQQLAKTRANLNESSKVLSAAGVAVDKAQVKLEGARGRLARTQQELAVARAKDRALAAKLKRAQAELAKAIAAVLAGQAKLDAEHAQAGEVVRDQYQQQSNLMPIAVLVNPTSMEDLQTRLQWSTTMFDTAQAEIDRLTAMQLQLNADRAKQAALEAQIAADRRAAAANLKVKKALELRAATEERQVAQLLRQRRAVESAAAKDVAQDKARYASLTRERASVEQRIAARIAKAKAEAARKAAARRAAERAAAAARKAAKAANAAKAGKAGKAVKRVVKRSAAKASTPRRKASSGGNAAHNFSYPVSAPITSPYGMRFHPVLKYWKLHDGTDFGAGCGAAIRAPYSGRVAERYFNAGYGNRLMIDHGYIDGRYVTTGYNHAIRYTVSVGQRVSRGQVIGYVGTTGYSTGCHLHLMVWLNGRVANPMTWF